MGPRRKQSGKASWRRKHFGGGRESQSIASKHEEVALKKRRGDRKEFGFRCVTLEELVRKPVGDVLQNFRNVDVKFDQRIVNSRNMDITELKTGN